MDTWVWKPNYALTNSIVKGLTEIEAARVIVESANLPPTALAELSRQARIRATHYSTRIEGNRLTLEEAEEVVSGRKRVFHGRERDVAEVRNYWDALARVEEWAAAQRPLTEELIQRIAGIALNGRRSKPQPYRSGQNVIRDSVTGGIVYMPPESSDVAGLMTGLLHWVHRAETDGTPVPVVAGLAHYQFVTIHPYYDGNGRTARLLATFILHRGGYGLRGIYSLEEYHSRDIEAYYGNLDVGGHHNYYMGRAEADLTGWLEYYVGTLSNVFNVAKQEAAKSSDSDTISQPEELRKLDFRARAVLAVFTCQSYVTSADIAQILGLSQRMARLLLTGWVDEGWLTVSDPSRKSRKYALNDAIRRYLDSQTPAPK